MFGEGGDFADFIDAHPVPLTGAGFTAFQARTEQVLQLANHRSVVP
jgi:hypothetical protein